MSVDALLPAWAEAGERRRAHVARVVRLLDAWADVLCLDDEERRAWRDAGRWHDALRDAPEPVLRELSGDPTSPVALLHGPAAAERLARDGERRASVLDAVRWHTVGCARWDRVGRALYLADYLEPGRAFARGERAFVAATVPHDFEGALRQVVRLRLEAGLRDGLALHPRTVELWNTLAGPPS